MLVSTRASGSNVAFENFSRAKSLTAAAEFLMTLSLSKSFLTGPKSTGESSVRSLLSTS